MYADTLAELHAAAAYIGLKREWFQDEKLQHYDLTANKRKAAVAAGVKEASHRHMVTYMRRANTEEKCPNCLSKSVGGICQNYGCEG